MAPVVRAELRAADAVPRLARLRGRRAERARLDRVRQAVRAPRRRRAAARLGARPRVAARLARARGRRSTARARSSTAARTAATWCSPRSRSSPSSGRPASRRRHLEPRHVPREHVAVPPRRARARVRLARATTASSSIAASPMTHIDAIRAPLFIQHGRNDPRVPVASRSTSTPCSSRRASRASCSIFEDEGHTRREAREPDRDVHAGGRVPRPGPRGVGRYHGAPGALAEWLGSGLQSRLQQFESARRLRRYDGSGSS